MTKKKLNEVSLIIRLMNFQLKFPVSGSILIIDSGPQDSSEISMATLTENLFVTSQSFNHTSTMLDPRESIDNSTTKDWLSEVLYSWSELNDLESFHFINL